MHLPAAVARQHRAFPERRGCPQRWARRGPASRVFGLVGSGVQGQRRGSRLRETIARIKMHDRARRLSRPLARGLPMKMRAAVIRETMKPRPYKDSKPFAIEEVELEPPGEGEVLVRIKAAGLCHSDLSTVNGDRPRPMPMVLGHEAAGEVVELGPGVKDLAPG